MTPAPVQGGTRPAKSFRRRYGVSPAWVHALNGAAILAVAVSYVLMSFPQTRSWAYYWITDELGPVELLTAAAFLWAAFLAGRLANQARRRNESRGLLLAYAGFAVFCFLCAMEETSWLQSIIDYPSPAWFRGVNEQGELNIHDLPGFFALNSAGVLVFGVLGLLGLRLEARDRWRSFAVPRLLAPLFVVITAAAALETFIDVHSIDRLFDRIVGTTSETVEMVGAIACVEWV